MDLNLRAVYKDLDEIRYFYAHQDKFEYAKQKGLTNEVTKKVEKYNNAIKKAPPSLYDLYISLYIENKTQVAFSEERYYVPTYVSQQNKKLCEFLLKELGS